MRGKAAGLDGFTPDLLSALPDAALDPLVLLLNECESLGCWPESITHWRLTFIPKGDCPCPTLDQVRPIAISSAIYRASGRVRLRNLAEHLAQVMQPWQAGDIESLDPETLLVAAEVDFGVERFPYGAALDYSKAFDSLDWPLALVALKGLKVPDCVLNLLRHQWASQIR